VLLSKFAGFRSSFFFSLADLVIQSGDELEDLRVVVLTNMSSSVVLAVPGL
jgi:hypothetical protein